MTTAIIFDLPPRQEVEQGLPESITHGCDYEFSELGKLMFYYNFIDYVWRIGELTITGRNYREDPVEIFLGINQERLSGDSLFRPMLLFLQRRFRLIRTMSPTEGYVLAFRHSSVRDEDI
jgi:hypothetical protein